MIPKFLVVALWTFLSCGWVYFLAFVKPAANPSWPGFMHFSLLLIGGGVAFHVFLRLLTAPTNKRGWLLVLKHAGGALAWGLVVAFALPAIGTTSLGSAIGVAAFVAAVFFATWHAASAEQQFRMVCGEIAEA